ncbi:MAG: hypothetical protein MUO26_07905 [Methanotrichaceae archaeon]|nr:hypothetical protein [Methanotrichaceae archaeon]
MVEEKPEYIKLKNTRDVLAYVQRLINCLRRKDLEIDRDYIGKIIYLLNTWLAAYKTNSESSEVKAIKERLSQLEKAQQEKAKK